MDLSITKKYRRDNIQWNDIDSLNSVNDKTQAVQIYPAEILLHAGRSLFSEENNDKGQPTRPNFTDQWHDNCVGTVLRCWPSQFSFCMKYATHNKPTQLHHLHTNKQQMSLPPRSARPASCGEHQAPLEHVRHEFAPGQSSPLHYITLHVTGHVG